MDWESFISSRCRRLNAVQVNRRGCYVLYWMQQSQRAGCNYALEHAVYEANRLGLPVMVTFGLTPDYPEANRRHYAFMLEGLTDTEQRLLKRGIPLEIQVGSPPEVALQASRQAALLVCDRGYLRHQIQWRQTVARQASCPVIEVESDALVPVEIVSQKAEYAARTIRPKLHRTLNQYLVPLPLNKLVVSDPDLAGANDFQKLMEQLKIEGPIRPVSPFIKGGYGEARKRIKVFLRQKLPFYSQRRSHPNIDGGSMMSPYLHFGQISPLEIALKVQKADAPDEAKQDYLEELIVRRELAINYVTYCGRYDTCAGLPDWARNTLNAHTADPRDPIYSLKQLESAQTHDAYWNAAMNEMKCTGYMHSYMRMYWGKKILQWRPRPQNAFKTILKLNNKYFIDGRDANSYAGVGWIFGLHDQAWKERPVFGKVRFMARSGLDRKFDMQGYVDKIALRMADFQKEAGKKPINPDG